MTFHTFGLNSYLAWMPADMQMTVNSLSAHVQWFSCQNNGADYRDIIKRCHKNLLCMKGREV